MEPAQYCIEAKDGLSKFLQEDWPKIAMPLLDGVYDRVRFLKKVPWTEERKEKALKVIREDRLVRYILRSELHPRADLDRGAIPIGRTQIPEMYANMIDEVEELIRYCSQIESLVNQGVEDVPVDPDNILQIQKYLNLRQALSKKQE